jgi:hypothetical protein
MLKEYAEKNGYAFIDLNPTLSPDGFLKDEYTYDGTHLTALGYTLWRDILAPYMSNEAVEPHPVLPTEQTEPAVPAETVPAQPETVPQPAEAPVPAEPQKETITQPSE